MGITGVKPNERNSKFKYSYSSIVMDYPPESIGLTRIIDLTPVACAIIYMGDSVLLKKRAKSPFKDMWGFPGGKFEDFDNSIKETADREPYEETGLELKNGYPMGWVIERVFENDKVFDNVIYFYQYANNNTNYLKETEEGQNRLFPVENLLEPYAPDGEKIIPLDFMIINAITRGRDVFEQEYRVIRKEGEYILLPKQSAECVWPIGSVTNQSQKSFSHC